MKERPILFSGAMVRAILDGRKTQTRRVLRYQPEPFRAHDDPGPFVWFRHGGANKVPRVGRIRESELSQIMLPYCPYGKPGDRLWVRETWQYHPDGDGIIYRATDPGWDDNNTGILWRPSIFMPRNACRIVLEVCSMRVERLQAITEMDAGAEGIPDCIDIECACKRRRFIHLWDSINAKRGYSWESNPVVRIIEFRRVQN